MTDTTIQLRDGEIRFALPSTLTPSVTRALFGRTALDANCDHLPIPLNPHWLRLAVVVLRWYRSVRPNSIGQRCVWDPSCSRYAELALRDRGMLRGLQLTLRRLWRCRPGRGGVDTPKRS